MKKVRAHTIMQGIVQGVFFRAHTQREARRLGVSGWVRNRYDGSVEALFEGDQEAVEELITWCRSGPSHARVDEVKVAWEEYTGEFSGFSIAH